MIPNDCSKHVKTASQGGDLAGHAVVIYEGGDNFSDQPKPLGGGGGRIACGVVKVAPVHA